MAMFIMTNYVNRTAMPIAGPSIMKEFGFSQTQMGSIYSAFLFSYAILMTPGGALADRFGPRRILGFTGLLSAVVTALASLVGHSPLSAVLGAIVSFQAIRLMVGAFSAPIFPGCARMTANWFDSDRRARVHGLVVAGAPLGAAITPLLVTWLIGEGGWRFSLLVTAALTAIASLIWLIAAGDGPASAAPAVRKPAHGLLPLFRNGNLLVLSSSYFALNYFEYIFFYWIYFYFGQVRHMSQQDSAVYTTILLLTMMASMPVGGWISDRLSRRIGLIRSRGVVAGGGMAASAALLYLGVNAHSDGAIVGLLALALACASAAEGPFWATAMDTAGTDAGAAGGLMNGIGNVGGVIAPVLTPYLAERLGWSAGLYFTSAVVLAGSAAWIHLGRRSRQAFDSAQLLPTTGRTNSSSSGDLGLKKSKSQP